MKKSKTAMALLSVLAFTGFMIGTKTKTSEAYNNNYLEPNIPVGYYDNVDLNKTPDEIKVDLYYIISDGYKKHSYSANNEVLKKTDEDPNHAGYVIGFYSGQSLSSGQWNKEHVWAKSHGFPESGYSSSEPYSDAHHLRPTLMKINSTRGNLDFGEVVNGKEDEYGNRWNSSAFEPRDEVKGDVARMMFYMETRYGAKTKFNLKLVEDSTTSGSSLNGRFGNLNTLIKWHYQDPVSAEEIYRNNVIYNDYQHNRNPYIDHPEYIDYIYPNDYESGDEVNQEEVDNVVALIAKLPTEITLEDETAIMQAKAAYDALNYKEKQLVDNYNVLNDALAKLDELKNPDKPVDPETPLDGDVVDFGKAYESFSYQTNYNLTVDNKPFLLTAAGGHENELRLGHNKAATIPSKYEVANTNGSALEMLYDVENVSEIEFTYKKTYGNPFTYYIFFSEDGGNTYTKVGEGSNTDTTYKAKLASPKTGRFSLVISGSKFPRLALDKMTLASSDKTPEIETAISSSLSFRYNENEVLNTLIRLGVTVKNPVENANYSVFYYNNDVLKEDLANYYKNEATADEFYQNIVSLGVNYKTLKVGELNRLSLDVTSYKKSGVAIVVVMEQDGKLYFKEKEVLNAFDLYQTLVSTGNLTDKQKELFDKFFA